MDNLLKKLDTYNGSSKQLEKVLNYTTFFANAKEDDYITYNSNHTFEYTPQLCKFIDSLYEANLVEDSNKMQEFLKVVEFEESICGDYNNWVRYMNRIICRPDLLEKTNLEFLRKSFLTIINLEKIIPGSWGIDVEVGTWLKLLRQLKDISQSWELKN